MKINWRISWSYAITVSIFVLAWVVVILLFFMSEATKSTTDVAYKVLLQEVVAISQTKSYALIFMEKPSFGYYYMVDEKGYTVAHTDKTKVGLNVREQVPGLFEFMEKNKKGVYEYKYEGIKRYVAFTYDGQYYFAHATSENELLNRFQKFKTTFNRVLLPVVILLTLVSSYFVAEFLLKKPRYQLKVSNNLVKNISENIIQTSSSASEIKAMAENTESAANQVDRSLEEFAAYLEESRAETETTIRGLNEFTNTIEQITEYTSKLAVLTESLGKLTDSITDISDNITVLAINVSIETSKQNIDREGLSRIAEMIMELSNSARNLAKESKQSLENVENIVTSTTLITEKITKRLSSVRESLNTILQVSQASTTNVDKLVNASRIAHESVEELYSGIEQLEEAIMNIKDEIERFKEEIGKFNL
ncbi:methyl-accepting chemotaxis protein [Fervidobacterium islandicum]|uniref:methyl-accepting chemotaxis protein n=1 Tax=Fervidobacterium islandicum TaxID=2423 RepID=UPI003A698A43